MRFLLAGLLTLTFACCDKVHATNVMLSWAASPSPNVAGYNVYYRTTSGNYLYKVNAGKATSVTISNLIPGLTYHFAAAAYDSSGQEGPHSPQISYLVGYLLTLSRSTVPGSPVSLQFQVVAGHWYQVQASTDLMTWTNIWESVIAPSTFTFSFTDPNAGSYRSRYYRLVIHQTRTATFGTGATP